MRFRGVNSVAFMLEATRIAIKALAGPEVAEFTAKYNENGEHWKELGYDKGLAKLNRKAQAAWKEFNLNDDFNKNFIEAGYRCFSIDVRLLSGTKVHAEWFITKNMFGEWDEGAGRVEIQDNKRIRGDGPYSVEVKKSGYEIIAVSAQRYTGFGEGRPTKDPLIEFKPIKKNR